MVRVDVAQIQIRVETMGRVPAGMSELAAAKVRSVLRHTTEPTLYARVMLAMAADPAVERPALASVNVDLNGRFIRAQAAGNSVRDAIEQLARRLRVRLDRAQRSRSALRGRIPNNAPGERRHES
jgi:ribosome-associated translation inhibitor RaiA